MSGRSALCRRLIVGDLTDACFCMLACLAMRRRVDAWLATRMLTRLNCPGRPSLIGRACTFEPFAAVLG